MFKKSSNQALAKIHTHFSSLKAHLTKQPLIIPLIVLAIGISLTGYGLIKNLKSNNQSASAEQLPGTPESGAKSRITELYDALVAQNKGSDTDVSGLTAAPGDWGAKWNRIKTAALKGSSGGGGLSNSGCGSYDHNDPQVNFTDPITCKQWSYPLSISSGNPVSRANVNSVAWSWDASAPTNRSVGGKTAIQLCEALGAGWRLPTKEELYAVSGPSSLSVFADHRTDYRWSASKRPDVSNVIWYVRWNDGAYSNTSSILQYLVSCVRQL